MAEGLQRGKLREEAANDMARGRQGETAKDSRRN